MKVLLSFFLCSLFLTSTIVNSFYHSNIPSLSILRTKRSLSNPCISTITTTTQINAKKPTSNLNTNNNNNNDNDNDQFLQWEQEEIELQKLSILDNDDIDDLSTDDDDDDNDSSIIYKTSKKSKSSTSSNTADNMPLPDYMQKTINRFESKVIDLVSMPASKLPVVAIIGMYVVAIVIVCVVIVIINILFAYTRAYYVTSNYIIL